MVAVGVAVRAAVVSPVELAFGVAVAAKLVRVYPIPDKPTHRHSHMVLMQEAACTSRSCDRCGGSSRLVKTCSTVYPSTTRSDSSNTSWGLVLSDGHLVVSWEELAVKVTGW